MSSLAGGCVYVEKLTHLANRLPLENSVFIVDKALLNKPKVRAFLTKYPLVYAVKAGEELKDVRFFADHLRRISKLVGDVSPEELVVVAMGGGSIGDFAGFLASIYKRGVKFVQVPTTWLAAVDASHGGKTALNSEHHKNLIGTFYPAFETWLVKEILLHQPRVQFEGSLAEVIKISIINAKPWARRLLNLKKISPVDLWLHLPKLVEAKMSIVRRDPQERTGIRRILNLGHTIAHVLELRAKLSHGEAVAWGLDFSILFSEQLTLLTPKNANMLRSLCAQHLKLKGPKRRVQLRTSEWKQSLLHDKKLSGSQEICFVVICGLGKVETRRTSVDEILLELDRQGFCR